MGAEEYNTACRTCHMGCSDPDRGFRLWHMDHCKTQHSRAQRALRNRVLLRGCQCAAHPQVKPVKGRYSQVGQLLGKP